METENCGSAIKNLKPLLNVQGESVALKLFN